jgi:hypothetical protein
VTPSQQDNSPKPQPAWAAYGDTAEEEDFIIGSPEGLKALRDHIDKAIQSGESLIEEPEIQFNGVRCKASSSASVLDSRGTTLANYGCFALAVLIIALAIYGAVTLVR